jgi:hypothetical protein
MSLLAHNARKQFRIASNLPRSLFSTYTDNDVVVCSFARTPIGKLGGALAPLTAPKLGAHVIKAAISRSGIDQNLIEEAFMGNVVSAGIGQAPSRQAVIYAGLGMDVSATDINKVDSFSLDFIIIETICKSNLILTILFEGLCVWYESCYVRRTEHQCWIP